MQIFHPKPCDVSTVAPHSVPRPCASGNMRSSGLHTWRRNVHSYVEGTYMWSSDWKGKINLKLLSQWPIRNLGEIQTVLYPKSGKKMSVKPNTQPKIHQWHCFNFFTFLFSQSRNSFFSFTRDRFSFSDTHIGASSLLNGTFPHVSIRCSNSRCQRELSIKCGPSNTSRSKSMLLSVAVKLLLMLTCCRIQAGLHSCTALQSTKDIN